MADVNDQSPVMAYEPAPAAPDDVFIFPASFAQQRLWFLQKLEPEQSAYNVPFAIRIKGKLRTSILERSLGELIRRHEILRTTFDEDENGKPVQVVATACKFSLPITDLRGVPSDAREEQARRRMTENARRPFDLKQGPLFRSELLRLADDDHILAVAFHHTIMDAGSWGVLRREICMVYEAFLQDKSSPLRDLPIQYGDYAVWQHEWLQGQRQKDLVTYWTEQLRGAPFVLEVPTDFARPPVQRSQAETHSMLLPPGFLVKLKELAEKERCSLFMVLSAALNVLLGRYSGQEDIVVGSPITERNRAELENLIGLFVNTLPLRTDLSGNPRFSELLARVRSTILGAWAHQDLPFEKLVEELKPERDLSRNPIFQVMFVFQETLSTRVELPGLTLSPVEVSSGTAKFDLMLSAAVTADGLRVGFTYAVDLFRPSTIQRMLEHFQRLLEELIADPARRISELSLMSDSERQLLQEWNDTHQDYPRNLCIHELFEMQAQRSGESVAVVFEGQQLTYKELNRRANQLAQYLRKRGVGPETLVGLCVERSLDMIVGLLGILKAGGAYVPLDPSFPKDRIVYIMEDAGASLLLAHEKLLASLPEQKAEVVLLDAHWPSIAKEATDNLARTTKEENLAYVIYTSGSTGKPKGVQLEHRSVVNFLCAMAQEPGISEDDVVAAVTTISFDIAGLEIYLPLVTGAQLVIISREEAADGKRLQARMQQSEITLMQATPTTWRLLVEAGWAGDAQLKILCGGESFPRELANHLLPRCHSLWNMYGPTETAIWSAVYQVTAPCEGIVPIGHPIANTQFHIVDRQMRQVPVGQPGQLLIGGDGLARGYQNLADLTAEKFISNPYGQAADRLYQTGDLARFLPDGNVEYLGRIDHQVKLRGFRIELGEIEAVLSSHPAVQQAIVLLREDAPGDKRLVGYIVAQPGQDPVREELRAHLKRSLPEYMVPAVFVRLDSLPLTPNGKIDRRALSTREITPLAMEDFVAPETPVEKLLAGIWEEVLRVSPISIHTNFFELGGHSLLATQVMSRIQKHLGIQLPLRSLFENPTISQLAKETGMTQQPDARGVEPTIGPLPRRDGIAPQPSPLSFAQQRLWVLDRLEPNSPTYNVPFSLRLSGPLQVGALESALTEVVRRHEVLRTEFHSKNGEPLQVVLASAPVSVAIVDLSTVAAAQREAEAMRLAIAESRKPFRLSRGPLLRASLLRLAELEHILLITVHHIAFDGWSTATLLAEVSRLYGSAVRGEAGTLPELPCQYGDYAAWQRQLLQGERLEQQLSYWKRQLAGAPASVELPTDRPRGPIQTFQGRSQTVVMPPWLLQRLRDLSRAQDVTLFMTLLAGFNVLLSRYSGQDDLVVGTPIAGRSRPEVEKLIGLFVNTLVLRSDVSGNPSFTELLGRVRETAMGAYAHQDIPFERLVEELRPERDMSRNPLFQIMFGLQNVPREQWQLPGLTLAPFQVERGMEKFDLSVSLVEKADGLKATFSYNTDLFDGTTITRMMKHFQKLLEELVADPTRSIAEFSLLMEAERHEVLFRFNDSAVDYRRDLCLHNFFEAQAERSPHAIALVCEQERLNYHELNARANRLAHYLQKCGVGPEVAVAICIDRSAEMLVGILAILKAGGAYVPLDPAYPRERLATILEDAKAPILVTQTSLVDVLPPHTAQVVCLDADWPTIAAESDTNPVSKVKPENLSYVLFTSGSTGRPKGVAIQHSSAAMLIQWAQNVFLPEEVAGTLFSTSMCFDLSVFEMFVPLSMGGKIIVAQNALSLPKLPAAREVTLINTVPSAIAELVRMDAVPDSVQVVNLAGEALPTSLAQKIYQKTKARKVYNLYGPTEDTTYSTYALVPRKGEVTIGKPLPNTQVYILDANRQPTPIGIPGELHLAGEGLARGYFGRADLTAERFLPNPFSSDAGTRMYRTGDLARFLPDGNIQYLGRLDNQVKLRGFRIELGEIESVLSKHPSVESAVVIAREDKPGDKRLVAYVVPTQEVPSVDLRLFLKASLPEYMLPSLFTTIEALPLTPNGKVNRRALPAPDWSEVENILPMAARDPLELMLLKTWRKVLGIPNIGIRDNFFDLGGHSLLSARLLSEVEKIAGREIPLSALFRGATVESLAQIIREGSESIPEPVVMEIQVGTGGLPFFAVAPPGAESLGFALLARHMGPDQTVYKLQGSEASTDDRPFTEEELHALSAEYIAAMRAVQPEGPYCLGGMCEGVHIAEKMVLDLEAQGQEVGVFAIFDTWVMQNSLRPWLWRMAYYRQRLRMLRTKTIADQLQAFKKAMQINMRSLLKSGKLAIRAEWQQLYWPQNFRPKRFRAPVMLFKRPKQPFYYIEDPEMGWAGRSAGGVQVYEIDFNHLEILREPHIRILGDKLAACIRKISERANNSHRNQQAETPADAVLLSTRV